MKSKAKKLVQHCHETHLEKNYSFGLYPFPSIHPKLRLAQRGAHQSRVLFCHWLPDDGRRISFQNIVVLIEKHMGDG
jgi:hypothetical protein